MSVADIIVLCVFFAINIAAVITYNVMTKDITIGTRLKMSFAFLFAGILYWLSVAVAAIKNIHKK